MYAEMQFMVLTKMKQNFQKNLYFKIYLMFMFTIHVIYQNHMKQTILITNFFSNF